VTLLYLVAGEASGDTLGARLVAALRSARHGLDIAGIGGERLAEQGLASLFPMRELALMGLLEVLPRLNRLKQRLDATVADIAARRPALLVTIDSPGFTLRVARRVRRLGIPVVHYVAPQVWAWRPGRVRDLAQQVDRLLCLLPFEPAFFRGAGIDARFVGHPVLDNGADQGDAARFRARHGLPPAARTIIVMPGSRRTETARLLPLFGATLQRLAATHPGLLPVVPLAAPVAGRVAAATAAWRPAPILIDDLAGKHDAYAAASIALVKSGTSSLELALAGVPMVVGYRVNWLTAQIFRRIVKVRYASLVNLLADAPIVPELLQEYGTPETLSAALAGLLDDPGAVATQRAGFARALAQLRPPEGDPSTAAAAAVLDLLPG
jgi:lipid-A-disaccharide synthase